MGMTEKSMHAQSAIEYLVTYGWAFLVIALVIAVLFYLGVFSANTFAARAQPGSCYVSRPYGPDTTELIALKGTCNNLPPEFTVTLPGGSSSNVIVIPSSPYFSFGGNTIHMTLYYWFKSYSFQTTGNNVIALITKQNEYSSCITFENIQLKDATTDNGVLAPYYPTIGQWYNVMQTLSVSNGVNTIITYVNGEEQPTIYNGPWVSLPGDTNALLVGGKESPSVGCGGSITILDGQMADIQIYNAVLSSQEAEALYVEGIGADPIDLSDLVGWWPLNGNIDDYSGNNNNGNWAYPISFTSQWTNGYTIP